MCVYIVTYIYVSISRCRIKLLVICALVLTPAFVIDVAFILSLMDTFVSMVRIPAVGGSSHIFIFLSCVFFSVCVCVVSDCLCVQLYTCIL